MHDANPSAQPCPSSIIPTKSIAIVTHSTLRATSSTPSQDVVSKTYLKRDVLRHNLQQSILAERTALTRLASASVGQVSSEAKCIANVARILAASVTPHAVTLTMARAPGISLQALLNPPSSPLPSPGYVHATHDVALSLAFVARVAAGVLSALRVVHAHDVVHLDVVPRNVVVEIGRGNGNGSENAFLNGTECVTVTLVDFGACFVRVADGGGGSDDGDGRGCRSPSLTSTPACLPPELGFGSGRLPTAFGNEKSGDDGVGGEEEEEVEEQMCDNESDAITPLADIWAVGVLICRMLGVLWPVVDKDGLPDVQGDTMALLAAFRKAFDRGRGGGVAVDVVAHDVAFDFVSKCLCVDRIRRFCAVEDERMLNRVPWSRVVDYDAIFAHEFLRTSSAT